MKKLLITLTVVVSACVVPKINVSPKPAPPPAPSPAPPAPSPAPVPPQPTFPDAPSRDQILAAHESFQGAVLHTTQFGDLFWWPTAWVSLNDVDRAGSYDQARSWGDTDITVSWKWEYGESGQPYGTGQRVPPADFTNDPIAFRRLVKDVIAHGFVPRIFMSGDDGYDAYMARLPQILAALRPTAADADNAALDLTHYVKLQMCYDSCVPGWAGPTDDKTKIANGVLATRAACPTCVIVLEFGAGYASQGDGGAFWTTPAGKAIDEVDWEGDAWPSHNPDQYWQILARWLGPAYHRPPEQPKDDDPNPPFYLGGGTPRGPYLVQCFEPYTYQWVRGQVPANQVPVAYNYLRSLGCPVIDTPQ